MIPFNSDRAFMPPLISFHRWRHFRFSLRTLLAASAILVISFSLWHTSRELDAAKAELWLLRLRTGALVVDDPNRLTVVCQPRMHVIQWRIHVPDGAHYRLRGSLNDLSPTSPDEPLHQAIPPAQADEPILGPGEWTIVYQTESSERKSQNGRWRMSLSARQQDKFITVKCEQPMANLPWTDRAAWHHDEQVAGSRERRNESFAPDEMPVLYALYAVPREEWNFDTPQGRPKIEIRLVPGREPE